MGPFSRAVLFAHEALDRLAIYLWETWNLHFKWVTRTLLMAYIVGHSIYAALTSDTVMEVVMRSGITALLVGGLGWFLDWAHYRARSQQLTNLRSLEYRASSFSVGLKVAMLLTYALLGVAAFATADVIAATANLLADLSYLAYLFGLDTVLPTKPPKKRRRYALPKLKLPVITVPGLQPAGSKAR